ncbi:hypothetical protein M0805_007474 [Coniferiporia weirii]|nr:hypothetical protein M0805_007474 [Coniferiporia weirii]
MGRNGKQRARVESADGGGAGGIHTTATNIGSRHHEGAIRRGGGEPVGWEGGGGWDAGAGDATGWPNDGSDTWGIQPADSASNVGNSNGAGWPTAAPAPPAKHVPMNTANGWGWDHATAAPSPPANSSHMHNQVRQGQHGATAADSMAALLRDLAQQQQQQQQQQLELRKQQQQQQEAQYLMQPQQYYQQPQQQSPHTMQPNHHQPQSRTVRHTGKHKRAEVSTVGSGGGGWGGDGWVGNDEGAAANATWSAGGGADAWNATDTQNGGWTAATSTVTPGGFGAGGAWGVSNNIAGDAWAGSTDNNGHAPGMVQSKSWGGWAPEMETQSQQQLNTAPPDRKMPKVIVTSPSSVHTEAVLSPKRQSHSLSGFLGRAFKSGYSVKEKEKEKQQPQVQDENKRRAKILKKQKFASPPATAWPEVIEEQQEEEEGFEEEEEEYGEDDYNDYDEYGQDSGLGKQGGWFAEAGSGWDDAAFPMPSKAYALAAEGRIPPRRRAQSESYNTDYRILDSDGNALALAHRALYSKSRLARNRIHWLFDPRKDERVSSLLDWVQKMHYDLAKFGFSKFLETRERGALFANADYRLPSSPNEPAFDWLTYDNVQTTMDRTLQESLAFYDPNTQVLVFVFLLSKSQNSMAIWRRKLALPNNIRLTYGPQITQATAGLRKNYPIHIDEAPEAVSASTGPPERSNSTKRRWFRWGRS